MPEVVFPPGAPERLAEGERLRQKAVEALQELCSFVDNNDLLLRPSGAATLTKGPYSYSYVLESCTVLDTFAYLTSPAEGANDAG